MSSSSESNNQNKNAIMINIKQPNYNYKKYKILYLIDMIHRIRVLNHIKKFMIWMI
jgi:hypothetical protein